MEEPGGGPSSEGGVGHALSTTRRPRVRQENRWRRYVPSVAARTALALVAGEPRGDPSSEGGYEHAMTNRTGRLTTSRDRSNGSIRHPW